jgi:hypothetical protein
MQKIPFYPNVVEWWRDMEDNEKFNKINYYWGGMYTIETISSTLIYTTFLFEKDNGNVDDLYIKNIIWNDEPNNVC